MEVEHHSNTPTPVAKGRWYFSPLSIRLKRLRAATKRIRPARRLAGQA